MQICVEVLDSRELLVLKSMLDSFHEEVAKQESLTKLKDLCRSFSNGLELLLASKVDSDKVDAELANFLEEISDKKKNKVPGQHTQNLLGKSSREQIGPRY